MTGFFHTTDFLVGVAIGFGGVCAMGLGSVWLRHWRWKQRTRRSA